MLHYISLYNSENQKIEIDTKAINVSGVSVNYGIFTSDNDISKYPQWFINLVKKMIKFILKKVI